MRFTISDVELIRGKRIAPKSMQLDSAAFFPFVDTYGQYKYIDWPGKVHSDKDLQRARRAEEKILQSIQGPMTGIFMEDGRKDHDMRLPDSST